MKSFAETTFYFMELFRRIIRENPWMGQILYLKSTGMAIKADNS